LHVKLYAAMGRAYLGRGSIPNRALLPKVGNRKSMIGKGIEKKIKGL